MSPFSIALELGANPSEDWARMISSTGMSNIFMKIGKGHLLAKKSKELNSSLDQV